MVSAVKECAKILTAEEVNNRYTIVEEDKSH